MLLETEDILLGKYSIEQGITEEKLTDDEFKNACNYFIDALTDIHHFYKEKISEIKLKHLKNPKSANIQQMSSEKVV